MFLKNFLRKFRWIKSGYSGVPAKDHQTSRWNSRPLIPCHHHLSGRLQPGRRPRGDARRAVRLYSTCIYVCMVRMVRMVCTVWLVDQLLITTSYIGTVDNSFSFWLVSIYTLPRRQLYIMYVCMYVCLCIRVTLDDNSSVSIGELLQFCRTIGIQQVSTAIITPT